MCLGRDGTKEEREKKAVKKIKQLEKLDIKTSIHLPIFLFDWYEYDYLSALFLSKKEESREKAFRLLEENLEKLENYKYEYLVLHFPGINHKDLEYNDFEEVLENALLRINNLAKKYNSKILLEYFGSNILFSDYNEWIEKIKKHLNLGILVDTGHLYFGSLINNFDFENAFKVLVKEASAFHFWTIKQGGFYRNNKSYDKYHHIVPNINQFKVDGWAFDTLDVLKQMLSTGKPIIIEAANIFKGKKYFNKSILGILKYVNKKTS